MILITDGLPTAHFEGKYLYLLYPPDSRTEEATMREGHLCRRKGITINIFLLPTWSQSQKERPVRLPPGRIDQGPRLLHRRQGPRPLRRLGLSEAARRS